MQSLKLHGFFAFGGDGEIRTLAPVSQPTPLAGEPLIATWVRLHLYRSQNKNMVAERVGFEPTALSGHWFSRPAP